MSPRGYPIKYMNQQTVLVCRVIMGATRGTHVDHLCRNTRCVNRDHLEVVTPEENARRGKLGGYLGYDFASSHASKSKMSGAGQVECRKCHGTNWRQKLSSKKNLNKAGKRYSTRYCLDCQYVRTCPDLDNEKTRAIRLRQAW